MKRADVDKFEKIAGQLLSIYEEISLLSKKNPHDALNKFKLKFINMHITAANEFLAEKYKPLEGFVRFEEDDMPQNSDVVFVVSQYLQALEKLRADNVSLRDGAWHWRIEPEPDEETPKGGYFYIRTTKPRNLKD